MAVGAALTLAAAGALGLVVVEGGLFQVTAINPHGPLMAWITHTTMLHAVRRRAAGEGAPPHITAAQVRQGFRLYDQHCVMCHGGPGIARASWTTGLTPTPPFLLDAARQLSPAELNVIVGDGIKMTAMPAWRTSLNKTETWRIVAFLEALPYLSATDYRKLRATLGAGSGETYDPAPGAMTQARAQPGPR